WGLIMGHSEKALLVDMSRVRVSCGVVMEFWLRGINGVSLLLACPMMLSQATVGVINFGVFMGFSYGVLMGYTEKTYN
ncbi:9006_t:CDS:2, partial [Funneliformis mosseae]